MGKREQTVDTNTHIPKPYTTSTSSSLSTPLPASNLPSMSASSPHAKKDIKDTVRDSGTGAGSGSGIGARDKKKERERDRGQDREGRDTHIRKPSGGSVPKSTISSEYKSNTNRSTDSTYKTRTDRNKRAPESPARAPSMFRGRSVPSSPSAYSSSSSYSSSFSKVGPGGMRGVSTGYRLPSLTPSAGGTIAPPRPPPSRPLPSAQQLTPPESFSQSHSHSYSLDGMGSVSEGEGRDRDRGKALIRPTKSYESRTKELSDYLEVCHSL